MLRCWLELLGIPLVGFLDGKSDDADLHCMFWTCRSCLTCRFRAPVRIEKHPVHSPTPLNHPLEDRQPITHIVPQSAYATPSFHLYYAQPSGSVASHALQFGNWMVSSVKAFIFS